MCGILEKPLGSNKEGDKIECEADLLKALCDAGIAREATMDDIGQGGDEGDGEDEKEDAPLDNMEPAGKSAPVQTQAIDNDALVNKAVELLSQKFMAAKFTPTGGHRVAGSDFKQTGGFKSIGDAAETYIRANKGDWSAARRYAKWGDYARKATGMSIGGSHQGSDLVPQEWATELWKLTFNNVPDLLGMMTKYPMRNQVENIPSWVQASATSAITASVTGEASSITATVGATQTVQLQLQKYAVLVNVSDELLRFNSYHLENVIKSIVPERLRYQLNDDVVTGSNSGANLLNNAAVVPVIRTTASHIEFADVTKMVASLWGDFNSEDAVFLTNPATIPELMTMGFPTRGSATSFPVWVDGGFGDSAGPAPKGRLLGKRVFTLENIPVVGSRGALILVNLKTFAGGYWAGDDLIADYTKALYFNLAQDSFRFMAYRDSVNPLTTPYQRKDGSFASNCVVLTAGSTSSS